ncbi:hypothetical protein ADUPG1_013474 [Aduncisulcus paluster]|uniref:Uncharacterized protein n=1 Tax=Aduncisulcus paluster TaxID=2918883 RepID=A0ABQ5K325_9EUKA|nr:hypothetical protein ADUPG1_013474 [Aduncisulcus paluster]
MGIFSCCSSKDVLSHVKEDLDEEDENTELNSEIGENPQIVDILGDSLAVEAELETEKHIEKIETDIKTKESNNSTQEQDITSTLVFHAPERADIEPIKITDKNSAKLSPKTSKSPYHIVTAITEPSPSISPVQTPQHSLSPPLKSRPPHRRRLSLVERDLVSGLTSTFAARAAEMAAPSITGVGEFSDLFDSPQLPHFEDIREEEGAELSPVIPKDTTSQSPIGPWQVKKSGEQTLFDNSSKRKSRIPRVGKIDRPNRKERSKSLSKPPIGSSRYRMTSTRSDLKVEIDIVGESETVEQKKPRYSLRSRGFLPPLVHSPEKRRVSRYQGAKRSVSSSRNTSARGRRKTHGDSYGIVTAEPVFNPESRPEHRFRRHSSGIGSVSRLTQSLRMKQVPVSPKPYLRRGARTKPRL